MAVRIIALFLVFLSAPASADTLTGKVVKITDGDTLYVLDANYKEHKIRLAGIDAPERKQAYGLASRKHLASIVADKQVTVEYQKRDRYGRIVGKVWINGVDACLKQVKAGFAWHYKKYQHEQSAEDRELYADAENQARNERLGLWRENKSIPFLVRAVYSGVELIAYAAWIAVGTSLEKRPNQ
jgi:endonuclease YncB( thermonuclease family)